MAVRPNPSARTSLVVKQTAAIDELRSNSSMQSLALTTADWRCVEHRARCGLAKLQTFIDAALMLQTLMKDARDALGLKEERS
jgi:hypothetical protein